MLGRSNLAEIANLLSLSDFESVINLDNEIARLSKILATLKAPKTNKQFYRLQSLKIEIYDLIQDKEKALKEILLKSNINHLINLTVDNVKYAILVNGILQELSLDPDMIFEQILKQSIYCETNADLNACEWLLSAIVNCQEDVVARQVSFYVKLLFHEETPLVCKDFIRKMIKANYYGSANNNRQPNQQQDNPSHQEKNSRESAKV